MLDIFDFLNGETAHHRPEDANDSEQHWKVAKADAGKHRAKGERVYDSSDAGCNGEGQIGDLLTDRGLHSLEDFADLSRQLLNLVLFEKGDFLAHKSTNIPLSQISRDVLSQVLPEGEEQVGEQKHDRRDQDHIRRDLGHVRDDVTAAGRSI